MPSLPGWAALPRRPLRLRPRLGHRSEVMAVVDTANRNRSPVGRPTEQGKLRPVAGALVAALLGVVAATVPAGPALAATWSSVTTPNPHAFSNALTGIDAVSATAAWAVGSGSTGSAGRPVLLRWNG